jgi:type IV secretion system protein VirB10
MLVPFWLVSAADMPSGTHVLLRMMNSVSTRTATEGTQVYLQTANPIAVDGQILVPVGSYVQGVVSRVRRSGRVAGRAEIAIRLETLTLPGGKALKFSPRLSSVDSNESDQKLETGENTVKQGSDYGRDAARIAILTGSGATIGGLADRSWQGAGIGAGAGGAVGFAATLLTRGREVQLKQGSTLDVVFDRPVTIE